jgi:hypothetical protein
MKKNLTMGLLWILCLMVGINTAAIAVANPIMDSTVIANDQCPGNPNQDDC